MIKKALVIYTGLFLLFTFFVVQKSFTSLDLLVTWFLQNHIPHLFDTPFSLFSLLGSAELVTLILLLLWAIYRKKRYIYVLIFFASIHVFEFLGKTFLYHPQPPQSLLRTDIPFLLPSGAVDASSSYPSGHAARTLFVSVVLWFFVSRSKKLSMNQKYLAYGGIIIFDFIMLLSRVYLAEHWLSDVIGGSFLGLALGFLSLFFL